MLIHLWIIFLIISFLFMYTVIAKDYGLYWNTVFILFSIILFFVLAAGIMDLEFPYEFLADDPPTNTIISGMYHIYDETNIIMSYFFYGLAVVMMVYFVAYIYTYIGKKQWLK